MPTSTGDERVNGFHANDSTWVRVSLLHAHVYGFGEGTTTLTQVADGPIAVGGADSSCFEHANDRAAAT